MHQNQAIISGHNLFPAIPEPGFQNEWTGFCGADQAYIAARIYSSHQIPLMLIAAGTKEAERLMADLDFFLPDKSVPVIYYPPYNMLPFRSTPLHNETSARRIAALYQMSGSPAPPIIVTTVAAFLERVPPKAVLTGYAELVMVGEELDREALLKKLLAGGYQHATIVEEPGDFCVRGGIVDIFTPLYPDPLRIEFDGEEVDSLRFFSAVNQRTIKKIDEAILVPAREVILDPQTLAQILSRIRSLAAGYDVPVTQTRRLIERIKRDGLFPGIESLMPLLYPQLDTLCGYAPGKTLFIQIGSGALNAAAETFEAQVQNAYAQAREDNKICAGPEHFFVPWEEMKAALAQKRSLIFNQLAVLGEKSAGSLGESRHFEIRDNSDIRTALSRPHPQEGLLTPLVAWLQENRRENRMTVIACQRKAQLQRIDSLLAPYGIRPDPVENLPPASRGRGRLFGCLGQVSSGFVWPAQSLALITEAEIFGSRAARKIKRAPLDRAELLGLQDLKKADLVVHEEHGIGRYEGLAKLKVDGATNDFLLILYRDDDKLYVPVDRMGVVQKYMGVEGFEPQLDKMGGKSWDRIKARVKKSAEKIAGELLELYAARKVQKGNIFSVTDEDLREFEAGFLFDETPDQHRAVEETLDDMQHEMPMDRLVCGDVGYGKTEVALRASFLAVNSGKQVAVLVPTTVLAEQHFATFSNRFARFAIHIACLSRFRSVKEQRQIIGDTKAGKVDIVIGTHRLLQKDVAFQHLGLLVIDEEQRFGVKHKEQLKRLRKTVDVLSLTATPIPRTLHMSLMGIRDISVISTPPEQRYPIITYVSAFDDALIADAIRKELARGGQIFFVHNNIHSIDAMARHLRGLVKEVRIGVAHGQMAEDELENVMFSFLSREFDLLLCTTIIESGIDIASANTIFINRADRFGLAQIYQLRGRVGRADEQAYAYLFIPEESHLTQNARKRLKVLMEHSDLGSGFQIAMNDLQIRGGGTILGASQSGHIAAVGYDMFLKLMENAVSELKGTPITERLEPEINIPLSAFLPGAYIPDIDQRLTAYRRLAKMTELSEVADFKAELIDRFGPLSPEAANLLLKIMLKLLCIKAGIKRLDLNGEQIALHFSTSHQKTPQWLVEMIAAHDNRFQFTPEQVLKVRLSAKVRSSAMVQTKNILKEIAQHVNG